VHGRGGAGWEIGQSVSISDLYQAVRPADDVGYIASLVLRSEKLVYADSDDAENQRPPEHDPLGEATPYVRVHDYELICAGTVTVGPARESAS